VGGKKLEFFMLTNIPRGDQALTGFLEELNAAIRSTLDECVMGNRITAEKEIHAACKRWKHDVQQVGKIGMVHLHTGEYLNKLING
jgi:hypothetical protein